MNFHRRALVYLHTDRHHTEPPRCACACVRCSLDGHHRATLPPLPSPPSRLKASTRDSRRRGCQDPAVRRGRRGGWWARLHRDRLAREMASSLPAVTRGQAWWLHQTARRTLRWPLLWALARYAQHADARNAGHRALHSMYCTYLCIHYATPA